MDEEARAAAYRQQAAKREQWSRDNAVRLRGNSTAAQSIRANWQPVVDAASERYEFEPDEPERHDRTYWDPA